MGILDGLSDKTVSIVKSICGNDSRAIKRSKDKLERILFLCIFLWALYHSIRDVVRIEKFNPVEEFASKINEEKEGIFHYFIFKYVDNFSLSLLKILNMNDTLYYVIYCIYYIFVSTIQKIASVSEDYYPLYLYVSHSSDMFINHHFKMYENAMIIGWNVFIHNSDGTIDLRIINEDVMYLDEMFKHDPLLGDKVMDAAASYPPEGLPEFMMVCENTDGKYSDQHNFIRNLVSRISRVISASNWAKYAQRHVLDRSTNNDDILMLPTSEKDDAVVYKHTRTWLIFPSELKMLKDATMEEILDKSGKFKVVDESQRVRIVNLKRWADLWFHDDEAEQKKFKNIIKCRELKVPCVDTLGGDLSRLNSNVSYFSTSTASRTPSSSSSRNVRSPARRRSSATTDN